MNYLPKLAQIISLQYGVNVSFSLNEGETPCADIHTKTIYMPRFELLYQRPQNELLYTLLHEAAHIKLTTPIEEAFKQAFGHLENFEGLKDHLYDFLNVLEDARINYVMANAFPGFFRLDEEITTKQLHIIRMHEHELKEVDLFHYTVLTSWAVEDHLHLHQTPKTSHALHILEQALQTGLQKYNPHKHPGEKMYNQSDELSTHDCIDLIRQQKMLEAFLALIPPEDMQGKSPQDVMQEVQEGLKQMSASLKEQDEKNEESRDVNEVRFNDKQTKEIVEDMTKALSYVGDNQQKKEVMLKNISHLIPSTRKAIELIKEKNDTREEYNHKRGRINAQSLYKVKTGHRNVFKRRAKQHDETDFVMSLVMDASGSMGAHDLEIVGSGALLLSTVLEQAGRPYSLIAFDDKVVILKSVTEKFRHDNLHKLFSFGGGTSLHLGMEKGIQELRKSSSPRKVMVYMTDGQTSSPDACKKMIQENPDIDFIAVGINDDAIQSIDSDARIIDNVDQLPALLSDTVKRLAGSR